MNNKEFITALAKRKDMKASDTQDMVRTVVYSVIDSLCEGENVTLSNLGTFEVKKRLERIIVNPGTKQKMLVPPKLVVNFKMKKSRK